MKKNKNQINILSSLVQLFKFVNHRRRYQFIFLIVLTLLASVAEIVSLGAIVPFIGILTQPEKVLNYPIVASIFNYFGILSSNDLMLPISIAFASAAVVAGFLRLILLWVSLRLANAMGADLSIEVYRRTLYQPYKIHVARNSSDVISGITHKVASATSILISVVTVVTSTALFSAILGTLLLIDPMTATIAMFSFGTAYIIIAFKTHKRLSRNSHSIAYEQTQVIKALQEGLGAIRDVLIDRTQIFYCNIFQKSIQKLLRANTENSYINQAPRFAMETVGIVLVTTLAYILSSQKDGIGAALPVLAALALGAQRLLPILQQLYANWAVIIGSQAALTDVLELLHQPLPHNSFLQLSEKIKFEKEIKFENIFFKYNDNEDWVLKNINLSIPKGTRIGFIGSTGSGKSTVLDLLMALLEPTKGNIYLDGQLLNDENRFAWQSLVAHVPQSIFLSNASIAENIAFGLPVSEIDYERVKYAATKAQLTSFIESNANGYDSFVGERGVRLSGGERQRIGIARALYKQSKILVFDEATSALDNKTEQSVMNEIESLERDLTIIIIAHRLSTLDNCDSIVHLENGKIIEQKFL